MSFDESKVGKTRESPYFQKTEVKNLGQEGLIKAYEERQASNNPYTLNAKKANYYGPQVVASCLADSVPQSQRASIKVLDVGAGTGLVAEQLKDLGFYYIEALEPCTSLSEEARGKQLYKEYHDIFLTGEHCGIAPDTYDAITCSGCLIENHLPVESLFEMIRLVKQGGFIVISARQGVLETVEAYKDKLVPLINQLEVDGKWRKIVEENVSNFVLDITGILWKFQVHGYFVEISSSVDRIMCYIALHPAK